MVLDGKSSQEYTVDDEFPQGSILGPTLFLLDINDLPDDFICDIAIDADDSTLYSKLGFDNLCISRTYVGLLLLAYARFWTCVRSHVRSFCFPMIFKVFKIFLVLIILYCLKTYCYIFDP